MASEEEVEVWAQVGVVVAEALAEVVEVVLALVLAQVLAQERSSPTFHTLSKFLMRSPHRRVLGPSWQSHPRSKLQHMGTPLLQDHQRRLGTDHRSYPLRASGSSHHC